MKNRIINIAVLTVCFLVPALPLLAQPTLPPPANAPVDGGLSLIIAAGVGYGIKKAKERKDKNI